MNSKERQNPDKASEDGVLGGGVVGSSEETEQETGENYVTRSSICGRGSYLETTILWDMMPCNLVEVFRRFGGNHFLHLQGHSVCCLLVGYSLARLTFRP
jgi:hypothetical protein